MVTFTINLYTANVSIYKIHGSVMGNETINLQSKPHRFFGETSPPLGASQLSQATQGSFARRSPAIFYQLGYNPYNHGDITQHNWYCTPRSVFKFLICWVRLLVDVFFMFHRRLYLTSALGILGGSCDSCHRSIIDSEKPSFTGNVHLIPH